MGSSRAARWQVAGEDGHSRKRNCGKRNRQRVVRFEAEEHRARGFAQGRRQRGADGQYRFE